MARIKAESQPVTESILRPQKKVIATSPTAERALGNAALKGVTWPNGMANMVSSQK